MTNSEVTFRIRSRTRVFMGIVGAVFLGMAAAFIYLAYEMQVFVSGADLGLGFLRWFFVLIPLSMLLGGGYLVAYWWTYRIVFDWMQFLAGGFPTLLTAETP